MKSFAFVAAFSLFTSSFAAPAGSLVNVGNINAPAANGNFDNNLDEDLNDIIAVVGKRNLVNVGNVNAPIANGNFDNDVNDDLNNIFAAVGKRNLVNAGNVNAPAANNNFDNDVDEDLNDILIAVGAKRAVTVTAVVDVVAAIEVQLKPILAELSVKGIAIARVQVLIPVLLDILADLHVQIGHIAPFHADGGDSHLAAIRISALIGEILSVLDHLVVVLKVDIAVLRPLIVKVQVALQAVIDVSVGVVVGLNVVIVAPLKAYVSVLARVGVVLVVGPIRI